MRKFSFFKQKSFRSLYFLLVFTIIWESADTAFTYVLPVILQERLDNLTLLGIVISFGAVASIAVDLLTGWKFAHKHYRFFYVSGFVASLLVALLSGIDSLLILAIMSALGGLYYELFFFGTEDFIAREVDYHDHTKASGFVVLATTLSALFIPVLIADSIDLGDYLPSFRLFVLLFSLALLIFFIFSTTRKHEVSNKGKVVKRVSLLTEMRVWRLLSKDSAPFLVLLLALAIQDAFFWTLGSIFAVTYAKVGEYSSLVIPLYMLPGLFTGFIATKMEQYSSKEKLAVSTFAISGLFLALFFSTNLLPLLLVLTFMSSFFSTLSYNFMDSLFSDLITRLGEDGNYMLGLRGIASDFAYVVGPITAGLIAENFGIRESFSFIGLVSCILAVFIYLKHPKKVRLEENKVNLIEEGKKY